MSVYLELAYNAWFFILALLLLAAFAAWAYRSTLPPVSAFLRRFLFALRLLAGAFMLLLIFEPIFGIAIRKEERPVIALLIDTSASMSLSSGPSSPTPSLPELLNRQWLNRLEQKYEVFPILFADTASVVADWPPDSLELNREGTNISLALRLAEEKLANRHFVAVLLLSDGVYNLGGDPLGLLEQYPAPIYTVTLGKDQPDRDIWIEEVIANEMAFANTRVPVEVVVRATGFSGRQAMVQLLQNGQVLQSQTVRLPADLSEKKVRLDFVPENVGMNKFEISIPSVKGETTDKNNRRTFYIKVLKSKLRIAVAAGAPGPDVSFLIRTLRRDKNFTVKPYIFLSEQKLLGDRLPRKAELDTFDCVVGINLLAGKRATTTLLPWLRSAVVEHKKPFLYILGPVPALQDLWNARDVLLIATRPVGKNESTVLPKPTLQGLIHPILRTGEEATGIKETIENLPPVFYRFSRLSLQAGSQVLLTAGDDASPAGSRPLLATIRQGERRVVAFIGGGFWRWHLMMQRIDPGNTFYERLILNSLRWVVSAEESKLLKVTTNKEIYRTGEEIIFTAQAYYEDFTPRDGLEITVKIQGKGLVQEIVLNARGNGLYEGKLNVFEGGDYRYTAVAHTEEREVSRDEGNFSVEPFRIEYLRTHADRLLMEKIARRSGARPVPPDSLEEWVESLDYATRVAFEEKEFPLWQRWPMLAVIVVALSIEWFIRKRKGML